MEKCRIQKSGGKWAVIQGRGLVYEAEFEKATAQAIADMENSKSPPKDWAETADRLKQMGMAI